MRRARGFACACAALAAAVAGLPAWGQARSAAEIALVEGASAQPYTVLGEVSAEIHQKALFAKTPTRELADRELREKAARLGADAVVDIRYESYSPLFSKKGFRAAGKAVRFTSAPVQAASAAPPAPQQAPTQTTALAAPAAPAVVPVPQAAPPPPASSGILLSEQDIAGRAYTVLGAVTSEAHQTSLFPKKTARQILDEDLRAQAARLGADAVILIDYEESSPLFSRKGSLARGKAVKFTTAPAQLAAAPPPAVPPAPREAPAVSPIIGSPAPAPVVSAAVSAAPSAADVAAPVAAAAPAPSAPGAILLSEQDIAGRAYTVLGAVTSEAHQTSLFPKKTARQILDEDLRAQAARLGADAVILLRYEENSPLLSRKGSRAAGVAVKYR